MRKMRDLGSGGEEEALSEHSNQVGGDKRTATGMHQDMRTSVYRVKGKRKQKYRQLM